MYINIHANIFPMFIVGYFVVRNPYMDYWIFMFLNDSFHSNYYQLKYLSIPICLLCSMQFIHDSLTSFLDVFISRDASWERGTTFNDLLFQYSLCDAKVCLCPKGNDFNAEFGYSSLIFVFSNLYFQHLNI